MNEMPDDDMPVGFDEDVGEVEAREIQVKEVTIHYKNKPDEQLQCNYIDVNGMIVRFSDYGSSEKVPGMMGGTGMGVNQETKKLVNMEAVIDIDVDVIDTEIIHPDMDGEEAEEADE